MDADLTGAKHLPLQLVPLLQTGLSTPYHLVSAPQLLLQLLQLLSLLQHLLLLLLQPTTFKHLQLEVEMENIYCIYNKY